jgi:hypothetical protein
MTITRVILLVMAVVVVFWVVRVLLASRPRR